MAAGIVEWVVVQCPPRTLWIKQTGLSLFQHRGRSLILALLRSSSVSFPSLHVSLGCRLTSASKLLYRKTCSIAAGNITT